MPKLLCFIAGCVVGLVTGCLAEELARPKPIGEPDENLEAEEDHDAEEVTA